MSLLLTGRSDWIVRNRLWGARNVFVIVVVIVAVVILAMDEVFRLIRKMVFDCTLGLIGLGNFRHVRASDGQSPQLILVLATTSILIVVFAFIQNFCDVLDVRKQFIAGPEKGRILSLGRVLRKFGSWLRENTERTVKEYTNQCLESLLREYRVSSYLESWSLW